jgi:fructokinase
MTALNTPAYDFIALGEALIDLISCNEVDALSEADCYQRFIGGQPTNLARNMALLGHQTALASCVGDDSFGYYIKENLEQANVDIRFLQTTLEAPTTIVPVTRTRGGTPGFMIYRGADTFTKSTSGLMDAVRQARIVHTSAFALSRDPSRSTFMEALQTAHENNVRISLDPNYHPAIWPDMPNYTSFLERAYQYVDFTKPSLDDCERIFSPGLGPADYAKHFIQWGAKIVLLTLGAKGTLLTTNRGEQYLLKPNKIKVADVTGAGDAFWSGFLSATIEGKSPIDAALSGQALAEIKLETVGPLKAIPDRSSIDARIASIQYEQL